MGLSRLGTAPSTANQGSTLSPSPVAGTLTQNAGQPVSSLPFADDFGDGNVINNNQDGGFFSLLSGATRDLDTAENTLTEAAGAVSNISEDFTHPSERSGGFGKGGTSTGAYNTGGAVGLNQGGSVMRALMGLIGRQPEFQAQLAGGPPNAQLAFNTMFGIPVPASGGLSGIPVSDPQAIRNIRADASTNPATKAMLRAGINPEEAVPMQQGGGLDAAFSQGFQQGTLQPMVSTPIPPTADPYGSAAGLSNLMRPDVYTGANAYNQGTPVGPPVNTQMLQAAQNFANPSVFSYNGVNQGGGGLSGMMPSGAPGSMNPMAGMQNKGMGAQPQQQQQMMPVQPYTMGT